jgi:uncharacterized protein (DUF2252 family)
MSATRKKKKPVEAVLPKQTYKESVGQREAQAKVLRENCPRKSHAGWRETKDRTDPIDLLIANCEGRVEHLVPLRYGRMMASPFAFYRGAAAIMASDLSHTPSTGVHLQICGDCHLMNFGGFATPERKLVFDINDFDETAVGPWEWDVKRLVASFVVASRANGFDAGAARNVAWETAAAYRDSMAQYAKMPILDVWYDHIDFQDIIDDMSDPTLKKLARAAVKKATESTAHTKEFVKLAVEGGSPARIRDNPPLIYHESSKDAAANQDNLDRAFAAYASSLAPERRVLLDRFERADMALKVVGVGSVGTYCGIILLVSGSGDPLFLQFKEARCSVIEPYIGSSIYEHHGQRIVVGQRLMQSASDIFLGWTQGPKRHFYLRQLRDAKISPDIQLMGPTNLRNYGRLCGRALARAHARSGDTVLLAGYMGKGDVFPDALASFAVDYADQNERDHQALINAVRKGRIEAQVLE